MIDVISMGADRTVSLSRPLSVANVEAMFQDLGIGFRRVNEHLWNRSSRRWYTEMDVELREDGEEIEFHYAYASEEHCTNALGKAEKIIEYLGERALLRADSEWR